MNNITTRFPPSPTGFLHIGGARTALFNWLYAKKFEKQGKGGKFVLRIEDTDRARHSQEAVDAILRSLKWLELDWDGQALSQFANKDRHIEIANQLLAAGKAYYCYASPDEIEQMREEAKATGRPNVYDRRWRDKTPADAPAGVNPVIRIKAPLDGETIINDKVQGDIRVDNKQLDDFILLRSDGTPTYMLAVVVDDHDMGVTHVIRGDDHINNAFRQKVIIDAMGWDVPVYAHIPLILGPDGAKLSKRHGAISVEVYKDMGYLPQAIRNYILRLGWSHGNDEIISMDQAIEWFDLDGIVKSPARFDYDKLDNLNQHYIREMDGADLIAAAMPFYETLLGKTPNKDQQNMILSLIIDFKDRSKTLVEFAAETAFFVKDNSGYDFDEKAAKTLNDQEAISVLKALETALNDIANDQFDLENVDGACRAVAKDIAGGKLGKIGMPLRCAVTGTASSPSIFEIVAIFGKANTIARLKYAVSKFEMNGNI